MLRPQRTIQKFKLSSLSNQKEPLTIINDSPTKPILQKNYKKKEKKRERFEIAYLWQTMIHLEIGMQTGEIREKGENERNYLPISQ